MATSLMWLLLKRIFPVVEKGAKGQKRSNKLLSDTFSIPGPSMVTRCTLELLRTPPPSELKCQHCQFAEKLQLQLRQQALSLELNSWRGRGVSAGVSKQGKK